MKYLKFELDHKEISIPKVCNLKTFDTNVWSSELRGFFKSTSVATAFNIRVAIAEKTMVPLTSFNVDAWDASFAFLTDNLLSEARTVEETECPTITRITLLIANYRLSTLQFTTIKLVENIKALIV
jgi:hypothetical protein